MPNTEVKLINAESTWPEAAREDRKLLIKETPTQICVGVFLCVKAWSLEIGAWSRERVHRGRDVRHQTVRRQTLAVSLVQTNRSLRNAVTRGDCECHAKLATFYKCGRRPPLHSPLREATFRCALRAYIEICAAKKETLFRVSFLCIGLS